MNETTIEWVRNPDGSQGCTSNPFTGCLNGCPYCYARRESYGRCKQADLSGIPIAAGHDDDPFYPRFHPQRLRQMKSTQKPAGIFLCDRSDYAADYWPTEWVEQLWDTIRACPQHRFYLLTHQPQELHKFSPFPGDCWVGVTATDEISAWSASFWMIPDYMGIKATIKFLSVEPLLKSIDGSYDFPGMTKEIYLERILSPFDWVIIGAMTGTRWDLVGKRNNLADQYPALTPMPYGKIWTLQPKLEWVLEMVEAADKAKIPVFLKNNLVPMIANSPGPEKVKLYEEMGLRQQMPDLERR